MTARVEIQVTAEDIGNARPGREGWADPVQIALADMIGLGSDEVDIDGDDDGYHATIGTTSSTTLVLDLPSDAGDWLEQRWQGKAEGDSFSFELTLDDWLVDLVRAASREAAS